MKLASALCLLIIVPSPSSAKSPDCGGPNHWPASMAYGAMKNAKLLTPDQINFGRTTVKLIASEKVKKDLWRQVYRVRFYRKDNSVLEAVTVSDASQDECSMGPVQTFVISKELEP